MMGPAITEVDISPAALDGFASILDERRYGDLHSALADAKAVIRDRATVNINSTATGGGVAEMLQRLVAYWKGAGFDARWLVTAGDAPFFEVTKRLHHMLHGMPGDGGELGKGERTIYETTIGMMTADAAALVAQSDIVVLHDPQTVGLAPWLHSLPTKVVWRCHVGANERNEFTAASWRFLRPYLDHVDAFIFSRRSYVPDWMDAGRVHIVPPSIDPFAAKNRVLPERSVHAIVRHVGLVDGDSRPNDRSFMRSDGMVGRVEQRAHIVQERPVPSLETPLIVQVSRWDPLKDMSGLMDAFDTMVRRGRGDAHAVLVGPDSEIVSDDPEGAEVYRDCVEHWRSLPPETRRNVHLVSLPMRDAEEHAATVNALQRHAAVIVQKSLAEGFGLTVTEAMWKARPIVAAAVGGIPDQIRHEREGLLVEDPTDIDACAHALERLLRDRAEAMRLAQAAHARAAEHFLDDRVLHQEASLYAQLVS
jgi:trehalose synthase